jgi:hypothetical protein
MRKTFNDKQLTLFRLFPIPQPSPQGPGSQDHSVEVRHLLSDILKDCPLGRFEVAGKLSEQLGREITKWMLDSWTGESRENHFPFAFADALETVCGTLRLTEFLAAKRGCKILVGEEVLNAELGKLRMQRQELDEKIRLLENRKR